MIQNGIIINGVVYEWTQLSEKELEIGSCWNCDVYDICSRCKDVLCFFIDDEGPYEKVFKRRENVTIKTNDDEGEKR